jgi:hypothetical protein
MSTSETMESHKFTFINKLTNEFYKFVGEIYIEYMKNKIQSELLKNESAPIENQVDQIENSLKESNLVESNKSNVTQTFVEYLLFKLYYNYGVKRRMVNEHIALLYYSRTLKGYKTNSPITMLCRHMLLDTRIMRIVSLGIPKAVKLDEFCNLYEIDKDNYETNFNTDGSRLSKYRVYKFSEGTMLIYNPSLKKYSITTITTKDDEDDEIMNDAELNNEKLTFDKSTQELLDNNVEVKFNQQFMYSTRKVVGTGCFNSVKTFFEMFEENNNIANTNLENIPEEFISDKVLVFNIEHPENRIISTQLRNFNTLCGVFQIKNELVVQEQYNKIAEIQYSEDNEDIIRTTRC